MPLKLVRGHVVDNLRGLQNNRMSFVEFLAGYIQSPPNETSKSGTTGSLLKGLDRFLWPLLIVLCYYLPLRRLKCVFERESRFVECLRNLPKAFLGELALPPIDRCQASGQLIER
jgi:hypothetical protein